jgi:hypothetical protein
MNRPNEPREPETDPVWDLLAESPPPKAGPMFASNVVRAARLEGAPQAPWRRWFAPRPLAGLATAAAAITIAFVAWPEGDSPDIAGPGDPAPVEDFEDLQAVAEEELLLAAADNLADFSDAELIALLGF